MKRNHSIAASVLLIAGLLALTPQLVAQSTNTNQTPAEKLAEFITEKVTNQLGVEVGSNEVKITTKHRARSHHGHEEVRVGGDFTLAEGQTANDVVVVFGKVHIEGTVRGDLVNVLGDATFGSNAVVMGDTVVIGNARIASTNTSLKGDVVIVGGNLDAPPGFRPDGDLVVQPLGNLFDKFGPLVEWFKRGFLWGRPIVPELPWVWVVAAIFLLVHFLLNLLFDRPLRACTKVLVEKPFTAMLVGLLVLLLLGPVLLILVATGVGIIVVPFLVLAVMLEVLIGKIAVARWIGGSVVRSATDEESFAPVRSFLIGAGIIYLLYVIPVVGFIVWAMTRLIGLGAVTMAFFRAIRRENPAPPAATAPPLAPSPGGIPPGSGAPPGVAPPAVAQFQPGDAPAADLLSQPRAVFSVRLLAFLLDFMIVMMTCGFLGLMNGLGPRLPLLVLLAYLIAFWTWRGTTVGGMVFNLRVVRVDGQPLRLSDACVRGLVGIFSVLFAGLGGLWILWDSEKQSWHDKVAGTYVVKVPRNTPLL